LIKDPQFLRVSGMDVSIKSLQNAIERLNRLKLNQEEANRLQLFVGSALYRDDRMNGYDAAALVEVIEHMEPNRLRTLQLSVFRYAKPKHVFITTPNVEYNVRFETLPAGKFRHADHRFEWSRTEFQAWAQSTAEEFGYTVRFQPIGDEDPTVGPPSQMAIFTQTEKK
ncbi:MAG: 3' terminal RNA ribose 2'-O-methyltransferase Hen1, partial [Bacteroidota bacterium]